MIIDSSIWINYLNQKIDDHHLNYLLINFPEYIGVTGIIITEVLQGTANNSSFKIAEESLYSCEYYNDAGINTYRKAAEIYRTCRNNGFTIRSSNDCIIASIALERDLDIYTYDKDFYKISQVFPIRLYNPY